MPHTVSHSVKNSMNQLTDKCFNKELAESVRRLAERAGLSLNQAELRLLRNGAGLTEFPGSKNTIGSSLDDLLVHGVRVRRRRLMPPWTISRRWMSRLR